MKNYYFWTRQLAKLKAGEVTFNFMKYDSRIFTLDNDRVLLAYSQDEDELVIWFEGSGAEFEDWVSNSNVWFFTDTDGIHDGFKNAADKFLNKILSSTLIGKNTQIVVGGYSRGGSIAQVCALQLSKLFKKVSCVTFGCARSFTKEKREEFNRSNVWHTRYEIEGDIVTRLPPKLHYFRHVGNREIIKVKGWHRFIPKRGLLFGIMRHKLYKHYC